MLQVLHYTDLKSPYAYLAFDRIMALTERHSIELITRPYTLQINNFMGSVAERDEHQWRKVKYSYMDCRRQAKARGLKLYGPKEIYDTRPINVGLMLADKHGCLEAYCQDVFKRFFEHEIDVHNHQDVLDAVSRVGIDQNEYEAFLQGEGGIEHDRIRTEAEELGVFGVPMLVIDGELFWGGDRLDMAEARIVALLQDRAKV